MKQKFFSFYCRAISIFFLFTYKSLNSQIIDVILMLTKLYSSNFDSNRLITIDTINVDDYSRLTLTRNLKKVLPIKPKDTITVYQDRYNKDLILTIQHESNTTDSFIIKTKSQQYNGFHKTKTIEKSQSRKHFKPTGKEKGYFI